MRLFLIILTLFTVCLIADNKAFILDKEPIEKGIAFDAEESEVKIIDFQKILPPQHSIFFVDNKLIRIKQKTTIYKRYISTLKEPPELFISYKS